jgi:6,7-dimethyl-8-ribityllumazine synthase
MASSDAARLPDGALAELEGMVGSTLRGDHDGRGLRIAFACGLFNGGISWRLLQGALEAASECGVDRRDVTVAWAPGAFELPLLARGFALAGSSDAVVCLGAVIRGETDHYDYVCSGATDGILRVALDTGVPCGFGVLTVDSMEQALARVEGGDKRDTGAHAAEAVLAALEVRHQLARRV